MRFLRRRALVCDAKVGGLGPAAAAAAAAEDGSMARRQFLLLRRCFFFFSLPVDSMEEEAEKGNRKYD